MNAFVIVALVITVCYIGYYSVIIMQDLYGKKDVSKSDTEVFDMNNIGEEEATVIGDGDSSISNDEESQSVEEMKVAFVNNMDQCDELLNQQKEVNPSSSAAEECRNLARNLKDVDVESTGAVEPEDLAKLIYESKSSTPKIFIKSDNL